MISQKFPNRLELLSISLLKRHNIFIPDILNLVERFSEKKVCVIGDTIIDEYVDCFPLGMSQEEPTLVVTPQETKRYLVGPALLRLMLRNSVQGTFAICGWQ